MASVTISTPDGKSIVLTVPDGATPEQVKQKALQAKQQYAASATGPKAESGTQIDEQPLDPTKAGQEVVNRVGRGAGVLGQRIIQATGFPDVQSPGMVNAKQAVSSVTHPVQTTKNMGNALLESIQAALSSKNVKPDAKASANTGVVAANAMTMLAPNAEGVPKRAIDPARRAFGVRPPQLGTPYARKAADEMAEAGLKNNILAYSGNAEKMLDRANVLKAEAVEKMNEVFSAAKDKIMTFGKKVSLATEKKAASVAPDVIDAEVVGNARLGSDQARIGTKALTPSAGTAVGLPGAVSKAAKEVEASGPVYSAVETELGIIKPSDMVRELGSLRPRGKAGVLRGGAYKEQNALIDRAIATVKAHGNEPLSLKEANEIKTILQEGLPYHSFAGKKAKQIAAAIRGLVDDGLGKFADEVGQPELAEKFKAAKKLYGNADRMTENLNRLAARQKGLNSFTPSGTIVGAAEFAHSGNPVKALAKAGIIDGLKQSGQATKAKLMTEAYRMSPKAPGAVSTAYEAGKMSVAALESLYRRRKEKKGSK